MSTAPTPPKVELVYDRDCPHVDEARARLREALMAEGMGPVWREWERSHAATPERVRTYGSPTVLVDGVDVAGVDASEIQGDCCRLYRTETGLTGAPSLEILRAGLRRGRASD